MADYYDDSGRDDRLNGGFRTMFEMAIQLPVADIERALCFYRDGLGFELIKDEEDPGSDARVATIRYGNVVLDLVIGLPPIIPRRDVRLYWASEKIPEALEVIADAGGRVQREMEYGVHCVDPDGHPLLVLQMAPEVDDLSI